MKSDAKLIEKIKQLEAELLLNARYQQLLEQFRLAQQRHFGQSREAFDGQSDMFDEVEILVDDEPTTTQTITYQRKKPTRKPLPKDLPREEIIHDIADKYCDCCGHELHQMGEDRSEKLEFIPASVKVIEHIRPKYSCRHCEKNDIKTPIQQQPMPASPIPKGFATPSLLAQLITSKYQYSLPLYRQESLFKQYGIDLSRQTMSDWILKSAQLFAPLLEKFKQTLIAQSIIQADETAVTVIHSEKVKSYMWLYCTGTDSPVENSITPNIVLFDYQNSRAGTCPANYLGEFNGYLQVDGYVGYEQTQATLVGCLAHARRYFMEAKKSQPKGKTGKADIALSFFQKLYAVERKYKGNTIEVISSQTRTIETHHR